MSPGSGFGALHLPRSLKQFCVGARLADGQHDFAYSVQAKNRKAAIHLDGRPVGGGPLRDTPWTFVAHFVLCTGIVPQPSALVLTYWRQK